MASISQVQVAVPTRGTPSFQTVLALQELRDKYTKLPPIMYHAGRLAAVQTRNEILARFLNSTAQVLVMIDDDVTPHPAFLDGFLPLKHFGILGFPCGFLWDTPEAPTLLWNSYAQDITPSWSKFEGVETVGAVGTGCCAIRRDVVEKLGTQAFRLGVERQETEDKLFCDDARAQGFEVGCNWNYPASHMIHITDIVANRLAHTGVPLPGTSAPAPMSEAAVEALRLAQHGTD